MTDWRTIGEGLKAQWREMHHSLAERGREHLGRVEDAHPLLAAIIAHRRGDVGAIPCLLRSGVSLSADDREALARFLEGGFEDGPRGPGAPNSVTTHVAGKVAYFVAEWKELCELKGIRTHGATVEMRTEAAEFICGELGMTANQDQIETILEYLRTGKVEVVRARKSPTMPDNSGCILP